MTTYNFKALPNVPSSKDMVDIVMSRTQRKTPPRARAGPSVDGLRINLAGGVRLIRSQAIDASEGRGA